MYLQQYLRVQGRIPESRIMDTYTQAQLVKKSRKPASQAHVILHSFLSMPYHTPYFQEACTWPLKFYIKTLLTAKGLIMTHLFFAMIPIQSTARSRKYLKDILYIYLLYIYFEIRKIRLIQALPCANKNQNKSSPVTSRSPITLAVSLLFSFFSIFCCCGFN